MKRTDLASHLLTVQRTTSLRLALLYPQRCVTIKVMELLEKGLSVYVTERKRKYAVNVPGTSPEFRKDPINLGVQLPVQKN